MEKQHHIQLLPGDIGETVFLPGDVSRAKIIADHFDSAELVASFDIIPILENAGVRDLFSEIIGSDTVPAIKPAPDLFLAMLERLDIPGRDCLVFEDAEKGMQAANTAGIPVVVIRTDQTRTFDFSDADLVLDSHAQFLNVVRA